MLKNQKYKFGVVTCCIICFLILLLSFSHIVFFLFKWLNWLKKVSNNFPILSTGLLTKGKTLQRRPYGILKSFFIFHAVRKSCDLKIAISQAKIDENFVKCKTNNKWFIMPKCRGKGAQKSELELLKQSPRRCDTSKSSLS